MVAASLGGPAAVTRTLSGLPADFPASVLVVQHRTPAVDASLVTSLQRRAALPVRAAEDGQPVTEPGITVLPARHTATVDDDGRLVLAATESFLQADALLGAVSRRHGARAMAVILTGRLYDGAAGVRHVKAAGGRVLVEDPGTAQAGDMPSAALATGCADLVMPLSHMARAIVALTMAPGAAELFRTPPSPWATMAA